MFNECKQCDGMIGRTLLPTPPELLALPPDYLATPQDSPKACPEDKRKQKGDCNTSPRYLLDKVFIFFTCVIQNAPPERINCHFRKCATAQQAKTIPVQMRDRHIHCFLAPSYW